MDLAPSFVERPLILESPSACLTPPPLLASERAGGIWRGRGRRGLFQVAPRRGGEIEMGLSECLCPMLVGDKKEGDLPIRYRHKITMLLKKMGNPRPSFSPPNLGRLVLFFLSVSPSVPLYTLAGSLGDLSRRRHTLCKHFSLLLPGSFLPLPPSFLK